MKYFNCLILSVGLLLAAALPAGAQATPSFVPRSAVSSTGVFRVAATQTTNLTAAQKVSVAPGQFGYSFSATIGTTNAADTTNATFRFEQTVDGVNWVAAASPFLITPTGVGGATLMTNVPGATVGNLRFVRLASIQNTNTHELWITNQSFGVR